MNWEKLRVATQLSAVPQMGSASINKVLDYLDSVDTPLYLLGEFDTADLVDQAGFSEVQAAVFHESRELASRAAESLAQSDVRLLARGDDGWPKRPYSPAGRKGLPWIFVTGTTAMLASNSIGIGGSRNASEVALKAAANMAKYGSREDRVIVSGGARGVDTTAHDAAIEAGGRTIVVLAQGILGWRIPPIWATALEEGRLLIVSEFPPEAQWGTFRAMQRNQTILWLSDAFFIPQSGSKGGTFEAGLASLRLAKPTLVARFGSDSHDGCDGNEILIDKGATPLRFDPENGELLDPHDMSMLTSPRGAQIGQLGLF